MFVCDLHVLHSNLTKQAILAHIVAQFVEKSKCAVNFLAHNVYVTL